jgi:hypothetical protein
MPSFLPKAGAVLSLSGQSALTFGAATGAPSSGGGQRPAVVAGADPGAHGFELVPGGVEGPLVAEPGDDVLGVVHQVVVLAQQHDVEHPAA